MIEWILDIAPREGMQFALGGVQSLKLEVDRLQLPLLVRIWAQSSRDGLYYDSGELTGPARHVVAAVVLANRAAQLDDVAASRFFQVLEQSAAQNEVALRREMEPEDAVKRSADLKRFIKYYDRAVEVRIVPRGEAEENFSLEAVGAAASAAGGERPLGASSRGRRYRPRDDARLWSRSDQIAHAGTLSSARQSGPRRPEALLCHRKQSRRRP